MGIVGPKTPTPIVNARILWEMVPVILARHLFIFVVVVPPLVVIED
jgi:hypothetical protein